MGVPVLIRIYRTALLRLLAALLLVAIGVQASEPVPAFERDRGSAFSAATAAAANAS